MASTISFQQFQTMISQAGGNDATYNRLVNQALNGRAITGDEQRDMLKAYGLYNSQKSSGGTSNTGEPMEMIGRLLKTQQAGMGYFGGIEQQMITIENGWEKITKLAADLEGKTAPADQAKVLGKFFTNIVADSAIQYLQEQTTLLEKINIKAGLTGKISEAYRESIRNAQPYLLRLGIGYEDLAASAAKLVDQTGKFILRNSESFERMGEVSKAYIGDMDTLVGMFPEFERIGVGAVDATEKISEAGRKSLSLGLQSKKTVEELSKNVGKLNEYGFKNGIDGLTRMVQKATEFRMSMENVYSIAEKVINPEGAIELSANLQVLGGAIGDFNDPLKLMYMATNNVEGLQDALIGAASSLTTYNTEQKRFEITGVNIRRAREMATQLGITYQDLSKGAIAAAERASAAQDLLTRGLTFEKDEDREFIMNIAQMKGGKMVIDIGRSPELKNIFKSNEVALDSLTEEQKNQILLFKKDLEDKTEFEIIRQQATDIENMMRDLNYIAANVRLTGGKGAKELAELMGFDLLKNILSDTLKEGSEESVDIIKRLENIIINAEDKDLKKIAKQELEEIKNSGDKNLYKTTVKEPTSSMTSKEYEQYEKQSTRKTTTEYGENNGETRTKVEVLYNFKIDATTDELARSMQRQPHLFVDWDDPKSYTKRNQ